MELNFLHGLAETPGLVMEREARCSENPLDESDEHKERPFHTMASHRFPLDHIPHSNC
jgi:hypothetical protein